jgi:hypothetical protein
MTDEVVDNKIVTEIPVECPVVANDLVASDSNSTVREADTVINPTITNSTTELTPKLEAVVPPPSNPDVITSQQYVETRVNSQHVETLQLQIRLFKTLSQKYLDSTIPKQLDANSRPVVPVIAQATVLAPKTPIHVSQPVAVGSITLPPPPIKQKPILQPVPTPVVHPRPIATNPTGPPNGVIQTVANNPTQVRPLISNQTIGPTAVVQKNTLEQKYSELKAAEPVSAAPPAIPLSWQCFSSLMFIGPARPADGMISIAPSVRMTTF